MRLFTAICLVAVLLVSCQGKKEKVINGSMVGKWAPVKLEMKGIPGILKSQIDMETFEQEVLESVKESGHMELKEDKTFCFFSTSKEDKLYGNWDFDGKILHLEIETVSFAFVVEKLDGDVLEVDLASMYKAKMGLDKIPGNFLNKVKMVFTYNRVD